MTRALANSFTAGDTVRFDDGIFGKVVRILHFEDVVAVVERQDGKTSHCYENDRREFPFALIRERRT